MSSKYSKYDYIVIGAGTAGGVIAKKLSDDLCTSVLVLECGTNMTNQISSPNSAVAGALATDNKFSFNTLSIAEPTIARQMLLSSGRLIGGSSEHNGMVAVRGSRELYDEWANLVGPQWSYNNIRDLFIKNETYTGLSQQPDERGKNGPIFVRQQNIPEGGLTTVLAKATSDILNIPLVTDYNTGIRDCSFAKTQFTQQTVDGGLVRSSTATGYLNQNIVTQGDQFNPDEFGIGGRKLTILAKTTVNRVLLEHKKCAYIATGVQFVRNGKSLEAFVRKGVIIAAGNYSSVILQRSGIGRSTDLTRAGIATIVESPNVGHNLQAHFAAGVGVEVATSRIQAVMNADPNIPFTLGAFKSDDGGGRRLQYLATTGPRFIPAGDIAVNKWEFNPNNPTNVFSIGMFDINPKSRGSILVAHSDPEALPSVDFNPLTNPDDLRFMVDQYINTFNIMQRAQEIDPDGIYRVVYPSEDVFHLPEELKRSRLADFVRASYTIIYHYAGQCRMGRHIGEGVVDGFLNVFGTQNLKVADLSIAPIIPDGNTAMPAQIIGLNAVRFIQD